jgi:hypothetical protein
MDIFYPIQILSDWLVYDVFNLAETAQLSGVLIFFIYDLIKIVILLVIITFLMGLVNRFFPVNKVRDYLIQNKLYGLEYLLAALFGTVTPFCSCSSVPLFIGFLKAGIPLGVAMAFLISSPLVDSLVVAMLLASFGLRVTVIYVLTGIVISVIAGYILGKMNLVKYLEPWAQKIQSGQALVVENESDKSVIGTAFQESMDILKTIFPYLLVGVGIGSIIHGYVPTDFFGRYLQGVWAVPFAVIAGAPIYVSAAGVIPIGQALVAKSLGIGTVLAFMMSAVALSIPSSVMLKKVMTWRLLLIFLTVVTIAIIFSGYFFNVVL